jgi:hypothetical protein
MEFCLPSKVPRPDGVEVADVEYGMELGLLSQIPRGVSIGFTI